MVRLFLTAGPADAAHCTRLPSTPIDTFHLGLLTEGVLTAMTTVISLSPGTLTVDTTPDASTIYVHFLVLDDVEAARHSLRHLEALVVHALGAPAPAIEAPPNIRSLLDFGK